MISPRRLLVVPLLAVLLSSAAFGGATRITLLPSAAQTATGAGAAFNVPNLKELACTVDVTAVSGTSTPTATVWLQGSMDGGTTYADLTADAVIQDANTSATAGTVTTNARNLIAATAAQRSHGKYTGFYDTIRTRWVISGTTPSLTFSVKCVGK